MKEIRFIVNGEPMAKQRPRLSTFNGFARAYTPKDTLNYENKVLMCYKNEIKDTEYEHKIMFDNEMLVVTINAYFPLRKTDYGKKGLNKSGREKIENVYCPTHKDCDNIAKIVLDALNGVCYKDDKQIVRLVITKYYTEEQPMVEITIKDILLTRSIVGIY